VALYPAIYAVGKSLEQFLQSSYPADLKASFPCTFRLVSSSEMAAEDTEKFDQTVTLFLHRITTNENFRAVTSLRDSPGVRPILYLDLHYLISYWGTGTGAGAEQTVLAWTMQQLQSNPILDSSIFSLSGVAAGWDLGETIQLVPADLSLQDILDIWDALGPKYRLSFSYLARVVRIQTSVPTEMPVVATRFTLQDGGPS
jgi:hypothetical protein